MCLVQGHIFGKHVTFNAPKLSSNALQYTYRAVQRMGKPFLDIQIYSDLMVLSASNYCNIEAQKKGHSLQHVYQPECDLTVTISTAAKSQMKVLAKSMSAQHSISLLESGLKQRAVRHLFCVHAQIHNSSPMLFSRVCSKFGYLMNGIDDASL